MHRYVGSQLEGRAAPTEGHVRRYWVQNLSGPGVSHDDDGDGWFSRANLFLALYAEVEAQGRGEGHATDAAESLFGSRLAGVRRTAAARKARPLGVAPQEDVEAATARAWDALGFAGGEDDLDDFVAGSDEDEVNVADW